MKVHVIHIITEETSSHTGFHETLHLVHIVLRKYSEFPSVLFSGPLIKIWKTKVYSKRILVHRP